MIDFSKHGSVTVHDDVSKQGICVQFHPNTSEDLSKMVELLDAFLVQNNVERSILIQNSDRFPVPCVVIQGIFDEGDL